MAEHAEVRLIAPAAYPTPYGWRALDTSGNDNLEIQSYPIRFLHLERTSTRWLLISRDLGFSEFQPEIIHVENELHSWITSQVLLYRRLFAPSAKVVAFKWDNIAAEGQGTKARLLERLAIRNANRIDLLISGNRAGRDILLAQGVPAEKVKVLPQWGIDPELFYPFFPEQRRACRDQLRISDSDFAIGFMGRLVEEKGILDLVRATAKVPWVATKAPTLVLVGAGGSENAARSLCRELGVNLVVAPPCSYLDVPKFMNALDVFVLPSQSRPFWREQFGHVLIEAMACGVPVIGSNSGEIPNVILDAGLVFPEREVASLAECITLCGDEIFRAKLRARGLEHVLKNYTNQKIADYTLKLYQQVSGTSLKETRFSPKVLAL